MFVQSTNSTNTLLKECIARGENVEWIRAGFQTAGRGQSGNGWESGQDKNLLCSLLLPPCPHLFDQNVIVSVAVHQVIRSVLCLQSGLGSASETLSVKWPNDIYWEDRKLAGILIENAIIGNNITHSIAGIGLNVNQTEWFSDAPNPVSLKQISGTEYDLDSLMQTLVEQIHNALRMPADERWNYYRTHLYRREGLWPFVEREVSAEPTMNAGTGAKGQFMAHIEDVLPTGEIVLRDSKGLLHTYHFKQVRYVLDSNPASGVTPVDLTRKP